MILNEFFNLPQVFEKDMEEGTRERLSNLHDKIRKEKGLPDPKEYLKIAQQKKKEIADLKAQDKKDPGMEEGIFGSKPSPVLPIVDKIAKVASGLTPQNVEVGKQIIQNKTSEITRMLSPQAKAGVDVIEQGVAEGVDIGQEWMSDTELDQYVPDQLQQQWRELLGYDQNGNPSALWVNLTGGYEPDVRDPEHRALMVKVANKWFTAKKIPNVKFYDVKDADDELEWLVQIGSQDVAEGKDDYVPPKEANYDDKYQAMVRRVGEKAKRQEKARQQQPPKTPVRENRRELLKQIIQS